ncbi:hypothetical protein PTKIN_Ptkin04bG0128200 [Pterospermum kingtungense]
MKVESATHGDWNPGNNSWVHSCQGTGFKKDDGWGHFKRNSQGRNEWDTKKLCNGNNSRQRSFIQQNGAPNNREEIAWHIGSRKREGSHQYIPGYKSSRFREDDNQTSRCWSSVNPDELALQFSQCCE